MSIHPLDDDDAAEPSEPRRSDRSPTSRAVLRAGGAIAIVGGVLTIVSSIAAGPETTRNAAGWISTSFSKIVLLVGVLVMTVGYRWDWLWKTFGGWQDQAGDASEPPVMAHVAPLQPGEAPRQGVARRDFGGVPPSRSAWRMLCLALTLGSFLLTLVVYLFGMSSRTNSVSVICLGLIAGMVVSTYLVLATAKRRMLANFGRGGLCASFILVYFAGGIFSSMRFGGFGPGGMSELLILPVMTLVIAAFAMFLGEAVAAIDEER